MLVDFLRLRYLSYKYELRQLLATFFQVAFFLYVVMYLALPIFGLTSVMLLGFIAENNTPVQERVLLQAAFLLTTSLVIKIQQQAILASANQAFFRTYPVAKSWQKITTSVLMIIAGNVFLIGPSLLLLYLPDWHTLLANFNYLIFCILVWLIGYLTLVTKGFPIFSVLIFPAGISIALLLTPMSATFANLLWLATIVVEISLNVKFFTKVNKNRQLTFYWQLYLHFIFTHFHRLNLRMLVLTFVLISIYYGMSQISERLNFGTGLFLSLIIGVVIGTTQFDLNDCERRYLSYFSILPVSKFKRVFSGVALQLIMSVPIYILVFLITSSAQLLLTTVFFQLLSIGGIWQFNTRFFIWPIAGYFVLFFSLQ